MLLTLAILLALVPAMGGTVKAATNGSCGDNVTWMLDEGTLTISGSGEMANYNDSSEVPWKDVRSTITSIVIEDGVTSIGENAFIFCEALTDITIPNSVTSIGGSAFTYCGFSEITIPASVTSIGARAFNSCWNLMSVTFAPPSELMTIDIFAFYFCAALSSITIPASVQFIGSHAFDSCPLLEKVEFEHTSGALQIYCDSFEDIKDSAVWTLQNGVEAFINDTEITSLSELIQTLSENYPSSNLAFQYTQYPLWVDGTRITSGNASDVLGDGTVSYNAATNILTLNGANITGAYDYTYTSDSYTYTYKAGIYSSGDLTISVENDSTITGAATTEALNNSSGIYVGGNLTMTVAEGKTLTITGGSTSYNSTGSYGIYVGSTYGAGSFTFTGPGTLNASGADTAAYQNYGIRTRAAVTISGGTVNAVGHTASSASVGIHAETGRVTVTGGLLTAISDRENTNHFSIGISCYVNISGGSLTASGYDYAVSGQVVNTVTGTGWTNADGTGASTMIDISSETQDISAHKKVMFPAQTRTLTITPPTNGSLAVTVNGSAFSGDGSVPVGAELTVTTTPNSGYRLAALTVGDSDVTSAVSDNVYSFAMPDVDTTIVATFAELAAVAAPTFTPAAGEVASGTEVAMTCATDGADIYYTTNGDAPSASSTKYTSPIPVTEAVTIKAIAFKDDMLDSAVASAAYTIAPPAEAYTITYVPGKGSGTMYAGTATEGVAFTLPECTFTPPAAYKGATKGFAGWKIGDTETIVSAGATYTFTENTTVTATWRTAAFGNYDIYVRPLAGSIITLGVIQGATIAQIKSVIEDVLDIPPAQQHLSFGGKLLEDERNLGYYNIQKEATINMVCTVTVTNDGHGSGSAFPTFGKSSDTVTLTAEPTSGYHFKEWQVVSGSVTIANNSFEIGSADVVIKAAFEADAPTIIPVTGVTLNKASTTLTVDGTETLTATVAPGDATNRAVTWSSGNPSVAAVDTNGVVTAVAPGTATITVTTEDGNHTADCTVTVGTAEPSLTAPTAKTGLTYTGEAQELVTAGSATGGTLQYKLGEGGSYGTSVPAAKDAGSYTVFYRVAGDANHSDVAEQSVSVTISQATLTVTADTLKKAYGAAVPALTYTVEGLKGGDKTSDVLTGALTTTATQSSDAGSYYTITQGTLAANANYTLSFTGATLTVLKAAQGAPAKGAGYTITGTSLSVDTASTNPNAGNATHYEIFDGTTVYTSGSVTMAANKTYYVRWGSGTNYNPSPYTEIPAEIGVTVMAAPASMGSVTTTGLTDGRCKIGSTVTVSAIPSSRYEFINWQKPDGSSASTDAAYSFTATESVILVAAFKEKDKVVATLPTVENKTYTGSARNGVKAAGTGCTITGTQSATNAGMYTITATLASGYDVWPDGTTAPKTLIWRIDKAVQAAPSVEVADTTIYVTIPAGKTIKVSSDRQMWSNASASMTGMATGSYYFYIVGDDNHYDSPMTVAYVSAPTITAVTIQPSALTAAGVTLNGTAEPKAYANGTYLSAAGFEYKAVGGSWIAVDGTVGGAFNASLSGLAQDTDYVCRAVVTLKDGSTKTYGAEITFHTPKAAPPDDGKIKAVIQSESEADTRKVFVSVERGNDVIATSDTVALNGNGGAEVSFNNLPYGHYNVVVHTVDGDYAATNMLSVEGGSEVATRFTIPIGKLATIVDVKTEETPKTAVEGLNEILTPEDKNNAAAGSQDVEIRLEVEKKAEDTADGASEIKGLDDNKIDTYLDMSLFKTTTDLDAQGNATSIETMDIGSTNTEVVEIAIPYANTSRSGLTMYRYHNALAEILTMLTAKPVGAFLDGTYYVDRAGGYIFLYASGFSTYAIGFAESAAYTVTFDANGGTGTMVSQSVNGAAALNANTFTRSGYTFIGWNTAVNGSGTSYANTANITPAADLTLYAQWKPNSSGSYTPSGGNGGYSPSTTTAGTRDTVPVSGDSGSVSVSVTVSGVTATIKAPTTTELNKVIGESVKTGDIVIDLRELDKDIATAIIPAETIRAIEKAVSDPSNDARSLTIMLTDGSVTFDAKTIAAVVEQMNGSDLQLHLDGNGTNGLKAAQQAAIKAMDVQAVYDIYLTSNGVRITDFKGGSATVTVTYTLKSGQMGSGVVVWYVADGGKMEEIPTRYDSKEVIFVVEHFSDYVVAYDEERAARSTQSGYVVCPKDAACPISTFKDTDPTEWYHDGVHWALENGVMNGVGDGLFLPNGTTSRAQVATILWRLAGRAQVSGENTFTDVAEDMWYTDAICWAAAQGVITGFERDGMNVFDPDAAITREQLAVMLYRYAKLDGRGFTGAWMFMLDYPDAADVSEWADEAMHWVIMKGIINGMDGRLNPQSSATRAQTATMFMRYYAESVK